MSDVFSIVANAYYPDQMARVQQGAEAGTTVEPPECPGCGGVGWNSNAAGGMVTCGRCGGSGENLLAVAPRDTDEDADCPRCVAANGLCRSCEAALMAQADYYEGLIA